MDVDVRRERRGKLLAYAEHGAAGCATRVRAFLWKGVIAPTNSLSTNALTLHIKPTNSTHTTGCSSLGIHHVRDTENRSPFARRFVSAAPCIKAPPTDSFGIDLKNTTDDALPNYLHSLKFKQIHTQTDVRLGLGYTAVVIAGALFYYDWKFGWEASKPFTLPAVVAYFLLNGAFSYWLWFVEKGVVYEGEGKTGKVRVHPQHMPSRIPGFLRLSIHVYRDHTIN